MNVSESNGSIATHHCGRELTALGFGQIGSELRFPWQQKAPIGLKWRKRCFHFFSAVFHPILFILVGNDKCMRARTSLNFGLLGPLTAELAVLERLKKSP